jgi:hypothetical protein
MFVIGTSKNRAKWNHQRRLYLIELLKIHDVPRFRTHNAWSKDAWTSIVTQFNQKFSLSFSIAQVKQKEQDMKKEFCTIKHLVADFGQQWRHARIRMLCFGETSHFRTMMICLLYMTVS